MSKLLVVEGPLKGQTFEIAEGASIGRSRSCAVRIEGRHVSRIHCKFEKRDSGLAILDNDSRNGIFVNGHRVKEKLLQPDDEIEVGEHVLVFEPSFEFKSADAAAAPAAPAPAASPAGWKAVVQEDEKEDTSRKAPPRARASTSILDTILDPFAEAKSIPDAELRASFDRLQTVVDLARAINQLEDDAEVMKLLLDRLVAALKASRGFVMLADDRGRLQPAARHAPPGEDDFHLSNVLFHQVSRERRAVIATDTAKKGPLAGKPVTVLAAPLLVRSTLLGFLYLEAPADPGEAAPKPRFGHHDLRFASGIASFAAVAIAHLRRLAKLGRAVDAARRRQELQHRLIGDSPSIKQVDEHVMAVGATDATVLVMGETGTGKELVARALTAKSSRAAAPFVAVNCAALSPSLVASEIFGHEKGAFSGADEMKKGLFEQAHGGTLFLDEVGELPQEVQAQLLRVLEGHSFQRVGGTERLHADVRIIAATSHDLEQEMKAGKFRQDLYWRLAVVVLKLPPLRTHREDIPKLVRHFLETVGGRVGGTIEDHVEPDVLELLKSHAWPGNVRELRNVVEQMLISAGAARLAMEHVPASLLGREALSRVQRLLASAMPLSNLMGELEKELVAVAMKRAEGNKAKASELLGISRPTLYEKLKLHGLDAGPPEADPPLLPPATTVDGGTPA